MSKTSPDARRDEGDLGANEYGRLPWALAGVSDLPPAEVRTLVRFDPARAHRCLEEFCEESRRAINEDLAAIKRKARDKQDQRRLEGEYRDAVLLRHNRVKNAAQRAYARCLEDASQAELAQVRTAAARGSSWRTAMNIGERAAGTLAAPRRPAGLRRTPAARPAARRPQVRRDRRRLRREARAARPGADREAVRAQLARAEWELRTVHRPELRKAEHAGRRYEPRRETSRPVTRPRLHAPVRRRVAPRRTPIARAAARRPGCRRTTRAGPARGDPSDRDEGDGDPPGPVARLRRWLDSRRDPWRVREAPLGLWRIRAEYVRLAARARRLP